MDAKSVTIGYVLGYNDGLINGGGGGGGNDEWWVYPEHWINIPDPAENQVTMLLEFLPGESLWSPRMIIYDGVSYGDAVINWGDGSNITIPAGERGGVHEYSAVGQYIVTITFNAALGLSILYWTQTNVDATITGNSQALRALKIGRNVKLYSSLERQYFQKGLVYIKFFGAPTAISGDLSFRQFYALECVEVEGAPASFVQQALAQCYSLKYADLGELTTELTAGLFNQCQSLKKVIAPNAEIIGAQAFGNCSTFEAFNAPKVTSIGASAFITCYSLKSANYPNTTSIGKSAFSNCMAINAIDFPNAVSLGDGVFLRCRSLESVNLPNISSISSTEFEDCFNLRKLVLAEGCNLNGNNVYYNNPLLSYTLM